MGTERLARSREHTGDPQTDRVQGRTNAIVDHLNDVPFLFGRRLLAVHFTGGAAKTIDHGLGRRPQGVLVLRSYDGVPCPGLAEDTTQPQDLTRQINLITPTTSVADIWVF